MNENADHENVQASSDGSAMQDAVAVRLQEYELWMRYAQADYDLVSHIYFGDYYPKPLEIICYHCQQAAEKAVKVLIACFGGQGGMPKLHDIQFLLTQIKNIVKRELGVEITEELLDKAAELTKYGVAPRYPNEIFSDDAMSGKAVSDAESIMQWVKSVAGKPKE